MDCTSTTHVQCRCSRIRYYNDRLRQHGEGGQVVMTRGVMALGKEAPLKILKLLAVYDAFDADNDPHQEHDMGAVAFEGSNLLWKIDYYDPSLQFASADAANPNITRRVLTIMLAEEY